jgi:hypothetical protein
MFEEEYLCLKVFTKIRKNVKLGSQQWGAM